MTLFTRWVKQFFGNRSRKSTTWARRRLPISVEPLEVRLLLSSVVVNTVADNTAADNALSLREAVALVNNHFDANAALGRGLTLGEMAQIDFTNPPGTHDSIGFDASTNTHAVNLSLGELFIKQDVTILGNGAGNTIIDSQQHSRIFHVTGGNVGLDGLTLQNGQTTGNNASGSDPTFSGGAILSL